MRIIDFECFMLNFDLSGLICILCKLFILSIKAIKPHPLLSSNVWNREKKGPTKVCELLQSPKLCKFFQTVTGHSTILNCSTTVTVVDGPVLLQSGAELGTCSIF